MQYFWPIILIVVSNIFYHICAKSSPSELNPFAALSVTYLVAAVVSGGAYFVFNRGGNLLAEYKSLNWTAFVFGLALVGLEAGSMYMYRVGWNVNTGQVVYSSILAVCLLFVGFLLYHEAITPTKVVGMAICLVGLYFINK